MEHLYQWTYDPGLWYPQMSNFRESGVRVFSLSSSCAFVTQDINIIMSYCMDLDIYIYIYIYICLLRLILFYGLLRMLCVHTGEIANLHIYGIFCSNAFSYYSKQLALCMVLCASLLFMKVFGFKFGLSDGYCFLECFKDIRFCAFIT